MPIDRSPSHAFHTGALEHGCLIRLDPEGQNHATLTFPINPESVRRGRTGRWEPRKRRRPNQAIDTPQQVRGELGGHGASALLAESETISFSLLLDATETILRSTTRGTVAEVTSAAGATIGRALGEASGGAAAGAMRGAAAGAAFGGGLSTENAWEVGVLPELAFLEQVSLGREPEQQRRGSRNRGTEIRPLRPDDLLLQLGSTRWFPCVLTELTITEQKFTPELVPVRAEVQLSLTVLEPVESPYNPSVLRAFDQLVAQRAVRLEELGTTPQSTLAARLGEDRRP